MPALRFLTLSKAISPMLEQEILPIVDLPHLALLTIRSGFSLGTSLVDHLNIPPSCGIEFWLDRDHLESIVRLDGSKLLFFLSKRLTHWPQDCSDRYLQAKINYSGYIYLGNSKRSGDHSYMTESDKVEEHSRYSKDPILILVLESDPYDSFAFFNQLLELYSPTFSTTTTLDLLVDHYLEDAAIICGSFPLPTFHSFTNVKTLGLLGQSPLFLLPLFQQYSRPDPLFPALQLIHLTDKNGFRNVRGIYYISPDAGRS